MVLLLWVFKQSAVQPGSNGRHVIKSIARCAALDIADTYRQSGQFIDDPETIFVSHVVAEKNGYATSERGILEKGSNRRSFVIRARRNLEYHFAGNQAERIAYLGHDARHQFATLGLEFGCAPIVQRYPAPLVLKEQPLVCRSKFLDRCQDIRGKRIMVDGHDFATIDPQFRAVRAGNGEDSGRKDTINLGDRAATDQRHRPAQRVETRLEQAHQAGVGTDIGRIIPDIEQRPVDIEK